MTTMNESFIRDIVSLVKEKQGDKIDRNEMITVVEKVLQELERSQPVTQNPVERQPQPQSNDYGHYSPSNTTILPSKRFIVSVFGANRPGIVHGITGILAELNCDILDISQKFVENLFYMILVVDGEHAPQDFLEIKTRLTKRGEDLSAKVYVQNEDVFRYVNRV